MSSLQTLRIMLKETLSRESELENLVKELIKELYYMKDQQLTALSEFESQIESYSITGCYSFKMIQNAVEKHLQVADQKRK